MLLKFECWDAVWTAVIIAGREKMKEHKVKGYRLREDYHIESCENKLFFFQNWKLIDAIDI